MGEKLHSKEYELACDICGITRRAEFAGDSSFKKGAAWYNYIRRGDNLYCGACDLLKQNTGLGDTAIDMISTLYHSEGNDLLMSGLKERINNHVKQETTRQIGGSE